MAVGRQLYHVDAGAAAARSAAGCTVGSSAGCLSVTPTPALQSAPCAAQLTSLKLKRYPMLSVPTWLGALTGLRYLLWDPALPADTQCE